MTLLRGRIVLVALVAVAVAGCGGSRLATASFPKRAFSFRYPASWKRIDWCWQGSRFVPLTYLTSSVLNRPCKAIPVFPPSDAYVGHNGVSVSWESTTGPVGWFAIVAHDPISRISGLPARIRVVPRRSSEWKATRCSSAGARVAIVSQIRPEHGDSYLVIACLGGGNLSGNEAAVRGMLASVRLQN
jgi:hypothetical protein